MPANKSARSVKEWPLLILSLAIVGAICFPIWQWLGDSDGAAQLWSNWTPERWGRLLFGPEQVACYCFFTWAVLILTGHYLEIRRQRTSLKLSLLPTEEGTRILHEDARLWQRQVDQVTEQKGNFILTTMIRSALGKYALSRSSKEASETVRHQAEIEQGRLVTSMATTHYLAWAIPAIGFLGTVRGLAGMLGTQDMGSNEAFNQAVTNHLNVAFDCTLIALALSLVVMFLLHSVQREEEALVLDCQEYCMEHLVNRMYEPEVAAEETGRLPHFGEEAPFHPVALPKRSTRIAP
jgi:biopolymer transport protein ExbB/TolQ